MKDDKSVTLRVKDSDEDMDRTDERVQNSLKPYIQVSKLPVGKKPA